MAMPTDDSSASNLLENLKELENQLGEGELRREDTIARKGVERGPSLNRAATVTTETTSPDAAQLSRESARETVQKLPSEGHQEAHESLIEKAFEEYKQVDERKPNESPYVIKKAATKKDDTNVQLQTKSQQQIDVEEILATGLADVFQSMSPREQEKFKVKGEETAKTIVTLIQKLKLTARKALHLISDWLKTISGVNKYFIEQETKIKTEEVMRYAQKHQHDQSK